MSAQYELLRGDAATVLATLPAASVHTVITSPPYWGLRAYLPDESADKHLEMGSEPVPDCLAWARAEAPCTDCFVCRLRTVMAALWRVLRSNGTCWLNLGDSYANVGKGGAWDGGRSRYSAKQTTPALHYARQANRQRVPGLKQKDLVMVPARVALALQADGWYLRNDVIWAKRNVMPESVRDRLTVSHEHIFLLTKRPRYYFDAGAIREPQTGNAHSRGRAISPKSAAMGNSIKANVSFHAATNEYVDVPGGRNKRDVWTVGSHAYRGAHFATFPPALIEPCILAGSSPSVCETCGAPWQRVVEKARVRDTKTGRWAARGQRHMRSTAGGMASRNGTREWLRVASVTTSGWQPSCTCEAGAVGGLVLDPFAGSGTTGVVARRHGRRFIGVDLNGEYVELARTRIEASLHETNVLDGPRESVLEGQLSLFAAAAAP